MSVVMTWLVNSLIVAVVLTVAAAAWEAAARWSGRPARWGWIAALVGSVTVPWAVRLLPAQTWTDIPVGMPMLRLDPLEVTAQAQAAGWSLVDAALVSWSIASLLMVAYLARVVAALARARSGWRETEVEGGRVYVTRDTGPAALGLRRGMVVVPAWALELDGGLRTLLLQHEREHVRAGDPRLLLGGLLLVAAMPWNPVLWVQLLRLRNAIELDCDSRVLARGADPERYGSLLLEVSRHRSGSALVMATFAEPRVFLQERIRRIAQWPLERRRGRAAAFTTIALVLFASALSARDPLRAGGYVKDAMQSDDVVEAPFIAEHASPMAVDTPPAKPSFTPMTVPPQLLNRDEVQRALVRNYPAMLRDAGIAGSPAVWFYIDETGAVGRSLLSTSSGYPDLDAAALAVAGVMRFSPAKNHDEVTAVWVEIPIQFAAAGSSGQAQQGSEGAGAGISGRPGRAAAGSGGDRAATASRAVQEKPTFTPMTEPPQLLNRPDVERALLANYPPLLKDAGIAGSPKLWFFIDATGAVTKLEVKESSGYPDLDRAALAVAQVMKFSPAKNRDEVTAVWVEIPIQFGASRPAAASRSAAGPGLRLPPTPEQLRARREQATAILRDRIDDFGKADGGVEGTPRQATSRAELPSGPSFTPMTVPPQLKNRDEVARALVRFYPPLMRDAGIGGSPRIWFFIDEHGTVTKTELKESSGYRAIDDAALQVAAVMQFAPAMNREEVVPVWVEIPIQFSAK